MYNIHKKDEGENCKHLKLPTAAARAAAYQGKLLFLIQRRVRKKKK